MNERDRKLRLVHSQPGLADEQPRPLGEGLPDDEPPFTDDELREAEAIRDAIEAGDEPVSSSLRAAHQPSALSEADHEALLARVLGDPLAPPTQVEQAAALRLRAALGDDEARRQPAGSVGTPHTPASVGTPHTPGSRPVTGAGASAAEAAAIAEMLRAAWRPAELPPLRNEALIARALAGAGKRRRRSEIATVVVGVLALAAGVALMVVQRGDPAGPRGPGGAVPVALIPSRSTMHLFDASTPFPRTGAETSRIDRISASRAADLRANRYAQWGVR